MSDVQDRLIRGEIAIPEPRANRLARPVEPTELIEAKQRLGLSDAVALPGSLFEWVQKGLHDTTRYILSVAQAEELIETVNASAYLLVQTHKKIKGLSGAAAENAKAHWTKMAYRQQEIVKAINQSASITSHLKGRAARDQMAAALRQPTAEKEMGIAIETSLIIAGTVVAVIAAVGFFVAVGWVITSAIKQFAEVKMYNEDIDATLATGTAVGKVAERASKADPIIGGLSEFFDVFNWKAVLAVVGVGAAGLLAYYFLKTRITQPSYPALPARAVGRFPKVDEEFPEDLIND